MAHPEGVGPIIRRLREEKEWNQTMLAALSGTSVATISKVESGQRNASSRTLARIADALGVEVADLFPKEHALRLPRETDKEGYEDFRYYLRALDLGALNRLAAELRADLKEATTAGDRKKATELYERVLIVGQFIDELDPPLYDIKVRRDGPTEVTFHHEPTAVELEELAKQHPGYVITGVTFRRDPTEEEVEKLKKEHPGYVVISRPAATP